MRFSDRRGYRPGRAAQIGLVTAASVGLVASVAITGHAATATSWTYDTGAGLVVTMNPTTGDLRSLRHRGVELATPGHPAAQIDSGWPSATVTRRDAGTDVVFTVVHDDLTQYYVLRHGDNTVYMATTTTGKHDPLRFIARLNTGYLPTSPVAGRTAGAVAAVEGSDVFRFADGKTASKFYSAQELVGQNPFGAFGPAHGAFILPGRQELTAGGPFFRDHEVNDTGSTVNITHVMYSTHYQTEGERIGVNGPYALQVTDGGQPTLTSMDWMSDFVPGLPAVSARGTVTGTVSGQTRGLTRTVALAGPAGQYWAQAAGDKFTIEKVRPGTYTATLYAGELAVGATGTVTVTAGATSTAALAGDVPEPGTIAQIGVLDGTPRGFRNADKIETMHPSDVRMAAWTQSAFQAGKDSAAGFPMAQFKSVNPTLPVTFSLGSVPGRGIVVRIATTGAFGGGRPMIAVGNWTSPASASPAPNAVVGRGITRGTWRGFNQTYTFTAPASALRAGDNTMTISVLSGQAGGEFLSPNYVFDAISIDPA
jgi:rhamnogalacturonan endolyase